MITFNILIVLIENPLSLILYVFSSKILYFLIINSTELNQFINTFIDVFLTCTTFIKCGMIV